MLNSPTTKRRKRLLSSASQVVRDSLKLLQNANFPSDAFPKDAASHEKNKEMEYSCRGGNETIWQNLIVPGFENRLGDQCVKVSCKITRIKQELTFMNYVYWRIVKVDKK